MLIHQFHWVWLKCNFLLFFDSLCFFGIEIGIYERMNVQLIFNILQSIYKDYSDDVFIAIHKSIKKTLISIEKHEMFKSWSALSKCWCSCAMMTCIFQQLIHIISRKGWEYLFHFHYKWERRTKIMSSFRYGLLTRLMLLFSFYYFFSLSSSIRSIHSVEANFVRLFMTFLLPQHCPRKSMQIANTLNGFPSVVSKNSVKTEIFIPI